MDSQSLNVVQNKEPMKHGKKIINLKNAKKNIN